MLRNYDDWKAAAPDNDDEFLMMKDEEEIDEPETPSRLEEIKNVRGHLHRAREAVSKAIRGAVLSRDRRAMLDAIERDLFDAIDDLDVELETRDAA